MGKGQKGLKPATSIKVRHILTEKASTSQAALEEIQKGNSFSSVAAKYSIDKARSGGSLGWMTRSGLVQEFSNVAFELEPSTTDKPIIGQVKTKFGYHLIMVSNTISNDRLKIENNI